jgi:hypothetical protein
MHQRTSAKYLRFLQTWHARPLVHHQNGLKAWWSKIATCSAGQGQHRRFGEGNESMDQIPAERMGCIITEGSRDREMASVATQQELILSADIQARILVSCHTVAS